VKQPLQVLALTMIDLSTNLLELIVVSDKESLSYHSSGDIHSTCLSSQHDYADKLYGALAIHLPKTSSHHQL
jgi:hypothetical protein